MAAHVVGSALHFADNALRFHHYHDVATAWLNPTTVVIAWVLQNTLGLLGLAFFRRGQAAGRPLLVAYGVLGLAGFLHYAAPPSHGMDLGMQALIVLEAATGSALAATVLWPRPPEGSPQGPPTPPFAAFK